MLINLFQSFFIIFVEDYLLPKLGWSLSPLDCLYVEDHFAFVFEDGGIIGVGKWAGGLATEPRQVVLIPAKILGDRP